ncbi:deoxyuridine 5'-triphosphate nucleotidohydrolase [Renibacterium salmoninarum ATCC 33209]|uniref:Deoxyuridine 5'-triphosphate nucleotidohydrolase n=1 Tax=Renibacterium salmoninarum (strain ATCC 33209 / DSM 20767 / JCM 11484 / NBRC 15589 / NCIMB 2235) TaxID=288705 RepID=A9WRC2_RENSM|nr:deoxyuridine 5'-triphosphate nucleotidohydrolase [Renibacterium salmoninarum ATCC 33209]
MEASWQRAKSFQEVPIEYCAEAPAPMTIAVQCGGGRFVSEAISTGPSLVARSLPVQLKMLDAELEAPSYAHPGDAGADLRTRIDLVIAPGERVLAPTGVAIALPEGYVALIHPRSGLATKHGLTIVNSPGTVDAGYRGEIAVTLLNTDQHQSITLSRGDRIAQMVIQRVEYADFVQVDELPDSVRGTGGFGSTGGFTSTPIQA